MKPLVIAHRGARSLAPENTLAAAKKAYEAGADLWETDVGVSRDGVLILMHDDSLKRTTDVEERFPGRAPWTFTAFTFEELRTLDAGRWFMEEDPFGEIAAGNVSEDYRGEKIPTVREALILTKELGWRINLELKKQPPPMEDFPVLEATLEVIREVGIDPEAVVLSSFDLELMRRARMLAPEFRVQAVLGFHRDRPIDWQAAWDFEDLNPRARLAPPEKVAELKKAGKRVFPWTINDPEEARTYFAAGAAGVFTDFPQRIVPLVR